MTWCASWCGISAVYVFFLQHLAPHVRIWDSVSLNTLHVLGSGFFDRGLVCLSFSKSVRKILRWFWLSVCHFWHCLSWLLYDFPLCENGGNWLCVVDDSNDHTLSVWDWQREERMAEVKVWRRFSGSKKNIPMKFILWKKYKNNFQLVDNWTNVLCFSALMSQCSLQTFTQQTVTSLSPVASLISISGTWRKECWSKSKACSRWVDYCFPYSTIIKFEFTVSHCESLGCDVIPYLVIYKHVCSGLAETGEA